MNIVSRGGGKNTWKLLSI